MKNSIYLILGLLFSFSLLNIACETARNNESANNKDETNFCSLVNSPEKYKSKTIQTKAIVLGFHSFIFYNVQCLESDRILALEMNYKSRQKITEAIAANKITYKTSFLNNNLYAEITVLGEVKENDEKVEPEVFHPKYKFFVNDIKDVNILSEEVFPIRELEK